MIAIGGTLMTAILVAIKQGWLEKKVYYSTLFENADGVHPGTLVQMAGLRAGSVDVVELQADNRILVHFYLMGKFEERIKDDSEAQLIRPFIIGDRVLDVSVGSEKGQKLEPGLAIKSVESTDILTLLSGKKLNTYFTKVADLLESVQTLFEAFLSKTRTESMVRMFDRLDPLLKNLNTMSLEVVRLAGQTNKNENLGKLLVGANSLVGELNTLIPEMNKNDPHLAEDLSSLVQNVANLTKDFRVLGNVVSDMGPELPKASKRALEALNEAVVLLKAMQRSFMIRGNVEEVRKEESDQDQQDQQNQRAPANEKP